MQLVTSSEGSPLVAGANVAKVSAVTRSSAYSQYRIIRRDGAVVCPDSGKISFAMTKAFLLNLGGEGAASARIRELFTSIARRVQFGIASVVPSVCSGGNHG